jgi:hypothetical protein
VQPCQANPPGAASDSRAEIAGPRLQLVNLVTSLFISGMGVAVATAAFLNRDKPEWRRDMPRLMVLALGQVLLGFASFWLLR